MKYFISCDIAKVEYSKEYNIAIVYKHHEDGTIELFQQYQEKDEKLFKKTVEKLKKQFNAVVLKDKYL